MIDVSVPHPARMYDYFLGGKDNFKADRDAAGKILAVFPQMWALARTNRRFLLRAARFYSRDLGIGQHIDVGMGLPTSPNLIDEVRAANPEALLAGVDHDEMVVSHARAMLGEGERTRIIAADVRDPDTILDQLGGFIDFDRPAAVYFVALLHFIRVEENPAGIVARFAARLAPGSRIAISHGTGDRSDPEKLARILEVYQQATSPGISRTEQQIRDLFGGLELDRPGLVDLQDWRPDRIEAPTSVRIVGGSGQIAGSRR